jgi:ADP-ribosylation factor family
MTAFFVCFLEPAENTLPTIGFSCSLVRSKRCQVKVFDLGGLPNIRGIWDKYFSDVSIQFCNDSWD